MLFIWDLHIKTDRKKDIFNKLQDILDNTEEKNIIFLWDYIYHFNYDPKVIWDFFNLLIKYSQNWKKIYILAWNHDYIKGHFIFSEAEKLANLANIENIKIISSPKIEKIEDKKVLFFPFYTKIAQEDEFIKTDKKIKEKQANSLIKNLFFIAYQNWKQDNKNQKISWTINLDLSNFLLEHKIDLLVHHFYIANTSFPGQFAKFSYKNIALSDELFNADFDIVSWHLHKCFKHKNYTCVWSFWNTSPLEENDTKVVFTYPDKFKQVIINPYISLDTNKKITEKEILNKWENIEKETEEILWTKLEKDSFNIKKVNLIVKSDKNIDFDEILEENLVNKLQDIKYRNIKNIEKIVENLKIDREKLSYSFESWKELAKSYIEKKYPEKKEEYLKIMEELGI